MRSLAIIPARGGSKRIPRKNVRDFLGKPIISYSIQTAVESKLFDEVMVSTDDEIIAEIAANYGANIPFLRSPETSSDTATTVDVLIEVLEKYKQKGIHFKYACCIYPTAPFLNEYRLREALAKMKKGKLDSVIPVTAYSYPVQRALQINNDKLSMLMPQHLNSRSQDLQTTYHDCGQFYWFDIDKLLQQKKLFTANSGAIVVSEMEVQDIDRESDWKLAELKYKILNQNDENQNILQVRRA